MKIEHFPEAIGEWLHRLPHGPNLKEVAAWKATFLQDVQGFVAGVEISVTPEGLQRLSAAMRDTLDLIDGWELSCAKVFEERAVMTALALFADMPVSRRLGARLKSLVWAPPNPEAIACGWVARTCRTCVWLLVSEWALILCLRLSARAVLDDYSRTAMPWLQEVVAQPSLILSLPDSLIEAATGSPRAQQTAPAADAWLATIQDVKWRKIATILNYSGLITEAEVTQILGAPRHARQFAANLSEFEACVPWNVVVGGTESGKTYSRD